MEKELMFTKELTISAPVSEVWDALVNPEKIKKYLFGTTTLSDWKKGSAIRFVGDWEGTEYEDKGTILQIEKERILQYDYWSSFSGVPDTPENYSTVTFELYPVDQNTRLRVSQSGFTSKESHEHSESSWGSVLTSLKQLVEEGL